MTVRHLFDELGAFLASKDPQVICISGKWGVGKTYAWNQALREARAADRISLPRYSYVSLFGQNSLADVRYALFENTVPKANAGDEADVSTLEVSLKGLASRWRKGVNLLGWLPQTADYVGGLGRIGFLLVRDQVVCIDDLERAGEGLRTKEVLGILSYLKERRGCKVVLLLNDEALAGPDKKDYVAQLEKVADTVLRFQPTLAEAADIGIDASTPFHEQLRENAIKLGITNIRVLKKVENYGGKLIPLLASHDDRVLAKAIHSVTLFAFSKFQPDDAPSREFIETSNTYEAYVASQNPEGDPHAQWRAVLSEFGFTHLDEFDRVLMEGVDSGYFDPEEIKVAADAAQARLKLSDQDNRFSAAWSAYHDSFEDNCDEVLRLMEEAVASCAPAISPMNFSSMVTLFKDLGHAERVPSLIASFIAGRPGEQEIWNLDGYAFRSDVKDEDVQAAFEAQHASISKVVDPVAVLVELGSSSGWNSGDIAAAASISEDDMVATFKSLRGADLKRAVNGAMKFQNILGGDERMQILTRTATRALRRIGTESVINRRRIERWGVLFDDRPGGVAVEDEG